MIAEDMLSRRILPAGFRAHEGDPDRRGGLAVLDARKKTETVGSRIERVAEVLVGSDTYRVLASI